MDTGIQILDRSDETETLVRVNFKLSSRDVVGCFEKVLDWLPSDAKVFLNDHRKDDSEGVYIFRFLKGEWYEAMTGGHGYSSNWSKKSRMTLFGELKEVLDSIQFENPDGCGYFLFRVERDSSANT